MNNFGKAFRNTRALAVREETIENDVKRAIVRVLASNKSPDSYYTYMADSSLNNYVIDAKAGITFTDSHNHRTTGYGWSVDGERIGDDVFIDLAVLAADEWEGMTYTKGERLIFALQHRPFDVSIGFKDERTMCSVCEDKEIWSRECEHWLGDTVEKDGKREQVLGRIEDAHLSEVSLVYDGATPGATTDLSEGLQTRLSEKAESLLRSGKTTEQTILNFCERMRIPQISFASKPISIRSRKMAKSIEGLEAQVEDMTERNDELNDEVKDLREQRAKDREEIRELKAENKELRDYGTQITEIEDEIRATCLDLYVSNLEMKDEDVSESQRTSYKEKVADMKYKSLRKEIGSLQEQRDVIEAVSAKRDESATPTPDEVTVIPLGENARKEKRFTLPFLQRSI